MITKLSGVTLAVVVLLFSAPLLAQDGATLVQAVTVKVRPGTNLQFEEYIRAVREAAQRQNVANYWRAVQSVSGEPTYTFNFPRSGWSDLADPGPQLAEVFGTDEAARLLRLAQESVEQVNVAFYMLQPDRSNAPPEGMTFDAVIYVHQYLNPGMAGQWAEVARKTRDASVALLPDAYFLNQTPSLAHRTSATSAWCVRGASSIRRSRRPGSACSSTIVPRRPAGSARWRRRRSARPARCCIARALI
jgi:hypothetical protein